MAEGAESQLEYREGLGDADKIEEGLKCNFNASESINGDLPMAEDFIHFVEGRA